jgi:hypothetical protein
VEIINSTISPPTTTHIFHLNIPTTPSLRTKSLGRASGLPYSPHLTSLGTARDDHDQPGSTTWYGVSLTVWNHADQERTARLRVLKRKLERRGDVYGPDHADGRDETTLTAIGESTLSLPPPSHAHGQGQGHHSITSSIPRHLQRPISGHRSEPDTEQGCTDSEPESRRPGRTSTSHSNRIRHPPSASALSETEGELEDAFRQEGGDMFWIPYALTLGEWSLGEGRGWDVRRGDRHARD